MENRLSWIDAVKGVAILTIVASHIGDLWKFFPGTFYVYQECVSIPIFFFIAGYLFNVEKYLDKGILFLKTRFNSLIVPLFYFAVISCFTQYAYYKITGSALLLKFWDSDLLTILLNIIQVNTDLFFKLESLWFLSALFICEILFYILYKIIGKRTFLLGVVVFAMAIPIWIVYNNIHTPFYYASAIIGMGLYFAGHVFRKYDLFKYDNLLAIAGLLTIFLIFGSQSSVRTSLSNLGHTNVYYWYIAAISGIVCLSMIIKISYNHNFKSRVLEFYGANSLVLLLLNIFMIYLVNSILPPLILGEFRSYLLYALTLLAFVPVIILINRYIPWLIGKKPVVRANAKIDPIIQKIK